MRQLYLRDRQSDPHEPTVIFDHEGVKRYLLAGRWGMIKDALSLYAMDGQLIGELRQLTLGIMPRFAIYVHRKKVGVIGKSLGFVREVVYIHGLHWIIVGNPLADRYRVFSAGRMVFDMTPVEKTGGYYHLLSVNRVADEPAAILVASILSTWARHKSRRPVRLRVRRNRGTETGAAMPYDCQPQTTQATAIKDTLTLHHHQPR